MKVKARKTQCLQKVGESCHVIQSAISPCSTARASWCDWRFTSGTQRGAQGAAPRRWRVLLHTKRSSINGHKRFPSKVALIARGTVASIKRRGGGFVPLVSRQGSLGSAPDDSSRKFVRRRGALDTARTCFTSRACDELLGAGSRARALKVACAFHERPVRRSGEQKRWW